MEAWEIERQSEKERDKGTEKERQRDMRDIEKHRELLNSVFVFYFVTGVLRWEVSDFYKSVNL